jgi:hypothetical protein
VGGHQQGPQGIAEGGLGPDPGRVAGGLVGQLQDLGHDRRLDPGLGQPLPEGGHLGRNGHAAAG